MKRHADLAYTRTKSFKNTNSLSKLHLNPRINPIGQPLPQNPNPNPFNPFSSINRS